MSKFNEDKPKKLFIGCLTNTVVEDQLWKSFDDIEGVSDIKVFFDENNKCAGFAFLTIKGTKENFNKALNKKVYLNGRFLDIKVAHNMNFRNSTINWQRDHKIFVKNLPMSVSDQKMFDSFSKFGEVSKAYVIIDQNTGLSKRFGYVEFVKSETVDEILKKDTYHRVFGTKVYISRFLPRQLQRCNNEVKNPKLETSPNHDRMNFEGYHEHQQAQQNQSLNMTRDNYDQRFENKTNFLNQNNYSLSGNPNSQNYENNYVFSNPGSNYNSSPYYYSQNFDSNYQQYSNYDNQYLHNAYYQSAYDYNPAQDANDFDYKYYEHQDYSCNSNPYHYEKNSYSTQSNYNNGENCMSAVQNYGTLVQNENREVFQTQYITENSIQNTNYPQMVEGNTLDFDNNVLENRCTTTNSHVSIADQDSLYQNGSNELNSCKFTMNYNMKDQFVE